MSDQEIKGPWPFPDDHQGEGWQTRTVRADGSALPPVSPPEPSETVELYDGWFNAAIGDLRQSGNKLDDPAQWLESARDTLRKLAWRAGPPNEVCGAGRSGSRGFPTLCQVCLGDPPCRVCNSTGVIWRAGPPGEPSDRALMAAQQVLAPDEIGFDVHIHLTTGKVLDALRAAYAIDGRGTATP